MPLGLLGKKLGMTQIFDETGTLIPVTLILAGPNYVVQKRELERDGYEAVQLGFDVRPERNVIKPVAGHFAKAGVPATYLTREFRGAAAELEVGQTVGVDIFEDGEHIDVIGTSKGRGFQGSTKRFHTARGPETHGSMYHRRPGSGGASSYPSRTWKGKKYPGHMGNERVTTKNLVIVKRDAEKNILYVKGSVPGATNGYVLVRKRNK